MASGGLRLGRTRDGQVAAKEDVALSPNALEVRRLDASWTGKPDGRPDVFRFVGEVEFGEPVSETVGRVGLEARDDAVLLTVTDIDDLVLEGVVRYRHVFDWCMWSKGLAPSPFSQ